MNDQQLATQTPFDLSTMDGAEKIAKWIADSGCYGITKPSQALTLMLMAKEEGKTISQLLKQVHVFDTGKLSQRADYTQSVFEQTGTILWHIRTPEVVAASFFDKRPIDEQDRERAHKRFEAQWMLDTLMQQPERDMSKESKLLMDLSRLSHEGEATIIRTLYAAEQAGITQGKNGTKTNWSLSSTSMLQWRCVTDGVKLIKPSVLSGLSSDVELQDVRHIEQQQPDWSHIGKQERLEMNDREAVQKMIEQHLADAASTPSKTRKSELYGLVSDLREKLAEMEPKTAGGASGAQPIPSENAGSTPAPRLVDATSATIEPPVDDDQLPGLDAPKVAKIPDWRDHVISTVKSRSYHGKKLGDLSELEIATLNESMSKKDMKTATKEVRQEAAAILMAYEATR